METAIRFYTRAGFTPLNGRWERQDILPAIAGT